MIAIKFTLILLLVMPFLFVMGTVASSAETIGPVSVGNYNINVRDIAYFGKKLQRATDGIVKMEIDIAKNAALYIRDAKPLETVRSLHRVTRLSAVNA
jgi:hypothetical protein